MTHARASTREDADEPLTRSDLPVLIREVVNTLSAHGSASQAAGQLDITDSEESSSSGTTHQTPADTGEFKN